VHEASVVEALIKKAEKFASENKAQKILKISVVAGETTGYMEEALQHYFSVLSKDTILENVKLSITMVKPRLECKSCGDSFERKRFSFDCPKCGKPGQMTDFGTEFYIDNMEIEG
jgi:hydrogenase nickel incorporation protein HypA/HybF